MSDIEGLELIYANTYEIDKRASEDPVAYPWKIVANFRPPEFMQVAFVMLHGGSEEFVLRAKTRAAIEACIEQNEWLGHSRLRSLTLTHPDGHDEALPTKLGRRLSKNWDTCPYQGHADDCDCHGRGGDR